MTFWLFLIFYFIWANLFAPPRHARREDAAAGNATAADITVVAGDVHRLPAAPRIPQISFKTLLGESRLEFLVRHTWDGSWVSHRPAKVSIEAEPDGLNVTVEAPYFGDPPAPKWDPGKPYYGLWNHEEIEIFFLNEKKQYLQVELGPYGQYLVLTFKDRRKVFKEGLEIAYRAEVTMGTNSWLGVTTIPWTYFPPNVTQFNAYGIHGSGEGREYDAAFPVPKGTAGPDFHNLEYFEEIPFRDILPVGFRNTGVSEVWAGGSNTTGGATEDGQLYVITQTWDSRSLPHDGIRVSLSPGRDGLHVAIEAPFFGEPSAPDGPAGEPFPGLFDYEVVEAFFLNTDNQYVELEFSPHGQHFVLLLIDERNVSLSELPLNYTAEISSDRRSWLGHATVPWDYFPPNVTLFNAYAIHGADDNRTYEALYPVPADKYEDPDFHKLDYFNEINFRSLLPEGVSNTEPSLLWLQPDALADLLTLDLSNIPDVEEDVQRELTIPPELLENAGELKVAGGDAREAAVTRDPGRGEGDEPDVKIYGDLHEHPAHEHTDNELNEENGADTKAKVDKKRADTTTTTSTTPTTTTTSTTTTTPPFVTSPLAPDAPEVPMLRFSISRTWNGKRVRRAPVNVTLGRSEAGMVVRLEAPYYEDPPMPLADPRKPFYDMEPHEVVTLFFLNDDEKYLEIMIGPHGHYHTRTYLEHESIIMEGLPLHVSSKISGSAWEAETAVPWSYLPPRITRFNVYAAHGTRQRRVYQALYPSSNPSITRPDVHALEDFQPIPLATILPASFDNAEESIIWASIDTLFEHDLIRRKHRKKL